MLESEGKELITPATTPGSVTGDEKCLVTRKFSRLPLESRWYKKYPLPYALLSISFLQIVFYLVTNADEKRMLRYEPRKQLEFWRFVTYMFIHDTWYHLVLNIITQCLFAISLEKTQERLKVVMLYFLGGVSGALGASCVRADAVVGASAGGYALLISHIPHIMMNYNITRYKICRCFCIGIIVMSDISYNLIHSRDRDLPIISWGAHAAGAVSGLVLGMLLYENIEDVVKTTTLVKTYHVAGAIFYLAMLLLLVLANYQIKKCTSLGSKELTYFC